MKSEVVSRLLELNRLFYQTHAGAFSATRGRVNPGVALLLARVPSDVRVLDLGCGNGSAAAFLNEQGFAGEYLGLDASAGLLEAARARGLGERYRFLQADLSQDWGNNLEMRNEKGKLDVGLCFATLHHIPGQALRLTMLQGARAVLKPGGLFFLSNWQFLNSPKLAGRVQPWAAAGLDDADVDENDYLLDWRAEETPGLRYVHLFDEAELAALAEEAGFRVVETFTADGETGDLGLYGVWQAS